VAVQGISMETVAVPEPKTWAMVLGGFAFLGLLGFKRKSVIHGSRPVDQIA
jgi:PEP-CTERM motif